MKKSIVSTIVIIVAMIAMSVMSSCNRNRKESGVGVQVIPEDIEWDALSSDVSFVCCYATASDSMWSDSFDGLSNAALAKKIHCAGIHVYDPAVSSESQVQNFVRVTMSRCDMVPIVEVSPGTEIDAVNLKNCLSAFESAFHKKPVLKVSDDLWSSLSGEISAQPLWLTRGITSSNTTDYITSNSAIHYVYEETEVDGVTYSPILSGNITQLLL